MAEGDTIGEGVLEQLVQKLAPCIERGDLDACVEEAARLAEEMGIGAPALLDLGGQMGEEGKSELAYVLALGAVGGLDGLEKARAYSNAGLAVQSLGNVDKAEIRYLRAIKIDPDYAAAHNNYANLLEELGDNAEAAIHYLKAIDIDPDYAAAHSNYANLLKKLGKKGEAAIHYLEAIEKDPKLAAAHNNYALLLEEHGKKGEAESLYLKAIEIDPKYGEAHSNYAILLEKINRIGEAESHHIKAIEIDPNNAIAHSNYATLLGELNRIEEAEIHYLEAIKVNPNCATAHYNYAHLLELLNRMGEAEIHYLEAIKVNPNYATAHYNYAHLLELLNRMGEAEIHYLKAIEIEPNHAAAHNNYANLLDELNRVDESAIHYLKAIEADPDDATGHSNYAILLEKRWKKAEAEFHYLEAIRIDPRLAEAHLAYGLFLIDYDNRDDALSETESASKLFKETGRITQSYLAKAWFYQKYSEKYLNQKEYCKSSDDADKASDEYFKAAETAEGDLIYNLTLQGNVLKAKSFMRKIPSKPWYNKIYKLLGTKPDISELVRNLQDAAKWYQNASACEVDGKKDVCDACHLSINVFSELLDAMSAFVKGNNAEINKDKWLSSLDIAREIYTNKELNKGVALVDSLRQLVTCVDELAKHKVSGLKPQADRLGECYNSLLEVNRRLEGALQIIADNATESIRDYAKKEGLGFIEADKADNKFFHRTFNAIKDIGFWVVIGLIIWVLSYYILPPYLDSLFNY